MMRHTKKKSSYFKVAFLIILLVGLLIFTGYSVKKERKLTFVESLVKDISVFVSDTLYAPIKFFKDKIEISREKEDIYKKYKKIEKELDSIEQRNSTINELEKENRELKNILNINYSLSDYEKINATVVSRNVGYWYDKLVINKGKKDGIEEKMAVVGDGGIIGYISEVSNYSSNVQLITAKSLKNKISVKIDLGNNKYANGIMIGYDEKKGVYKVEGISYSGDIEKDSKVTTTGLGDSFPSGLLIGNVSDITTDDFDLGKIVEVKPSVDFENISYVAVVKRKENNK